MWWSMIEFRLGCLAVASMISVFRVFRSVVVVEKSVIHFAWEVNKLGIGRYE